MSAISEVFHIYIDSHNRLSGTDTNFTYSIAFPTGIIYDRVVLLNAIIPKSYYLINSRNNTFTLRENTTDVTITIPVGDYLLNTFRTVIQGLLNTNSPNGWTYTVTYPNINTQANTGKYTFNVSGNSGSQPSIIITNNLYEQFGFNRNSTNTFVSDTLTSVNVIKLQVEDRLLINSNIVQGKSQIDTCVLQEINAAPSPDFSTIVYQCTAPEHYSKPLNYGQNVYDFSITDEDGQVLDTNGLNNNFTLCVFRTNKIFDKMAASLQLKALAYEKKVEESKNK